VKSRLWGVFAVSRLQRPGPLCSGGRMKEDNAREGKYDRHGLQGACPYQICSCFAHLQYHMSLLSSTTSCL
jgi:hypothetical protein